MEQLYTAISDAFAALYNEIYNMEKKLLLNEEFKDVTMNDVHIIHAIGLGEAKNMSTLAGELCVTVGSLTTAMNGLVRKGYVVRERSSQDRRVVYSRLSESGERVYRRHQQFHEEITGALMKGNLPPEELLARLNACREILNSIQ